MLFKKLIIRFSTKPDFFGLKSQSAKHLPHDMLSSIIELHTIHKLSLCIKSKNTYI